VVSLGIASNGTFYYGASARVPTVFTATLDWDKHTAAATPLEIEKFSVTNSFTLGDWSPDGQQLAYLVRYPRPTRRELKIVSLRTNETRSLKPDLFDPNPYFRWSSDGRSFISSANPDSGQKRTISTLDAINGQANVVVELIRRGEPGSCQPVWARDGQGIFYFDNSASTGEAVPAILFLDLQTKTQRQVLALGKPFLENDARLSFDLSPDGRQLAMLSKPLNDSLIISLVSADGGQPRELHRREFRGTSAESIIWTPDGQSLMWVQRSADAKQQGVFSFPVSGGGLPRQWELSGARANWLSRIRIHPDGKQLALAEGGNEKRDVRALENFLPLLAAEASAATSK
jgi:Tol biopolymer transport system component